MGRKKKRAARRKSRPAKRRAKAQWAEENGASDDENGTEDTIWEVEEDWEEDNAWPFDMSEMTMYLKAFEKDLRSDRSR